MVELQRIAVAPAKTHGLNFLVNYAWSKSLDTGTGNGHGSGIDSYQNAYQPGLNYGLSDFNSTNTLVGQVVYELPFGAGRQFALHGVADEIVGGWRLSTLFQWHSGVPFTPVIQSSVADGIDPVGNPNVGICGGSPLNFFNPAAFANPASGTFGDLGRNTLIGPGFWNVNLSIAKEFRLPWEGMRIEIRADAYDLFNHINYHNPDGDVGYTGATLADSNAGRLTDSAGFVATTRVIQLGAHFRF